jgi:UDP-N-acetylmuramate--alanine ligase
MTDIYARIGDILRGDRCAKVHLVGVGGVGMAGLAAYLDDLGYTVSGCDLETNAYTARLEHLGIKIFQGHSPDHIDSSLSLIVRSTAVPVPTPELQAAKTAGIPIFRRGEVFPAVLRDRHLNGDRCVVAISGTHGKTTTTAMTAHLLRGGEKKPAFFVGGEWEVPGMVYGGGDGGVIVVEADESDGTLAHYQPEIGLITGIDYDHMEHFAREEAFLDIFRTFIGNIRENLIYCADDQRLCHLVDKFSVPYRPISYGFSESADYQVVPMGSGAFSVVCGGQASGPFRLPVPGRHNMQNAAGALAVADVLGVPVPASAFDRFQPVGRRFEPLGCWQGIPVYSDYAHHPTEIRALIGAAQELKAKRLLAIFEPHRYTRSKALGEQFPAAFAAVDHLVLAPIYPASETPVQGGTDDDLATWFQTRSQLSFERATDLDDAWDRLVSKAAAGDVMLLIGAGRVDRLREKLKS